jgi:tocopherol O-methyltransferase
MDKQAIATWYDESSPLYRYFWYLNSDSFALHYGFWDNKTKNFGDALQNTNKVMAEQANITQNDWVLDAGCGIGGSVLWLAKYKKASVVGISISTKQIEKAKKLAKQSKVDHLVSFSVIDYLQTGFPNESFDVVWAIESVCHADKKEDFLKEAFRVLKKGGRIIIADGFKRREPKTEREKQVVTDFYKGMLLPNLYTFDQFEDAMKKTGFKHVTVFDKTHEILPSAKRFALISRFMYPLMIIAAILHIVPNIFIAGCRAGIVQYEVVQAGVGGYGIMYGEK